jgi:hypothetical protein
MITEMVDVVRLRFRCNDDHGDSVDNIFRGAGDDSRYGDEIRDVNNGCDEGGDGRDYDEFIIVNDDVIKMIMAW